MKYIIYLDESGDLGWEFNFPAGKGGSSRYLTLAYIIVPKNKTHLPKRILKSCYNKYGFNPKTEIKGNSLKIHQRIYFVEEVIKLLKNNPDITLGAITVNKQKVQAHIKEDGNKLYNYMIKLALISKIQRLHNVELIRDKRSIKVKSGNSLEDYLQIELWFEKNSKTKLIDNPQESHKFLNLQFIDWISYIVWSSYEQNKYDAFNELRPYMNMKNLYF